MGGCQTRRAPPEGGAEIDHRRNTPRVGSERSRGSWQLEGPHKTLAAFRKQNMFVYSSKMQYNNVCGRLKSCDVPFQQCAESDNGNEHGCSQLSKILSATAFLMHPEFNKAELTLLHRL